MSAIHPYAWHNGTLIGTAALQLSPLQTGLLTGWGLFSTLRIYQGVPFALEDHWERLEQDGERLAVETAGLEEEARRGFAALIERNQAEEAVARIYLIRNRGGLLDSPQERATDLLIFTRATRTWGASARLGVQPHGRHAASPFAGTKTLTWAHNLVLVENANRAGCDDVVLLNERGEVAECTAANIFAVRGRRLLTPRLDAGALAGISRKVLLRAAPRAGWEVEEAVLREEDLYRADEVFLTSSTREVQPVERIGAQAIGQGPVAGAMRALLEQEIAAYVAERRPRTAAEARA